MPKPQPFNLVYALSPPWHRRRRTRRSLLAFTAMLLIGTSYWWGPRVGTRARLLWLQHQCAEYSAPADRIVFSTDPGLLSSAPPTHSRLRLITGTIPKPYAGLAARPWEDYYALVSWPGMRTMGTAFLHSRRRPDRTERLVAIDIVEGCFFGITSRVFSPGSLLSPPAQLGEQGRYSLSFWKKGLRVFAGQPDWADDSHFILQYEDNGVRHFVDGWLQNDDTVVVEQRETADPVTPPAPSSPGRSR